jgi:hypothetical protein
MNLRFSHPVRKPSRVTYDSLAALARQGLGKSRLGPAEAAEVRAAIERHKQRQLAKPCRIVQPGYFLRRLENILESESGPIYRIICRHYFVPHSRWIDKARTNLTVRIGQPAVHVDKYTVWHRKHPWKGTELYITLSVPSNWRSSVLAAGLADAGGLLTLSAKQVAEDAWEASWLVQGRGYEFRVERGFIVRAPDGTYAHARTLKRARAIADGRAKLWAEKIRQTYARKRAEAQARLRELRSTLAGMAREQIVAAFGDIPISLNDSIRAGNCPDGTRQWINKWADGRTTGTVREVLETGAPLDEYLIRALTVAIARAK